MLSEKVSKKFFKDYMELSENNQCFDCGSRSAKWASITNGIIICMNCAGIHRGLGVQLSFVRSTIIDNWNERYLAFMQNGGNKQLSTFFQKYSIPAEMPQEYKYNTKAAWYYRRRLLCQVENRPFLEDPPTLEEGAQIIEFNATPQSPPSKPKQEEEFQKQISQNGKKLQQQQQQEKFKQLEQQQNQNNSQLKSEIKNIGQNVVQKTKKLGNQGKEMAKKGMKSISEGFGYAFKFIKNKAQKQQDQNLNEWQQQEQQQYKLNLDQYNIDYDQYFQDDQANNNKNENQQANSNDFNSQKINNKLISNDEKLNEMNLFDDYYNNIEENVPEEDQKNEAEQNLNQEFNLLDCLEQNQDKGNEKNQNQMKAKIEIKEDLMDFFDNQVSEITNSQAQQQNKQINYYNDQFSLI